MNAEDVTLIEAIRNRRSIRSFSDRPVEKELVEKIIEDALHAPNAGNRRQQKIVVSFNAKINERLGKIHHVVGTKYRSTPDGQPISYTAEEIDQSSSAFYGAPVVITFFGSDHFIFSEQDTAILIDHIYLLSYAYGLSACMIGEISNEFTGRFGQSLLKKWNVPNHYHPCGFIVLGYTDQVYPKEPEIPSHPYPEIVYESFDL